MDDLINILAEIKKDINRLQYARQYSSIDNGALWTPEYQQWQLRANLIRSKLSELIKDLKES